jgi:[CysO sulfur-carrier protein]-S-L-cysteine hydrolase
LGKEKSNESKWKPKEQNLNLKVADVEQNNTVLLSKNIYSKIMYECKMGMPNEACGLLSGCGNRCKTVWPMKNIEPTPFSFAMDIQEQDLTFDKMKRRNESFVGIYHSHPFGSAVPSHDDVIHALYPSAFYFVISISHGSADLRCFKIIKGKVKHVEVIITD